MCGRVAVSAKGEDRDGEYVCYSGKEYQKDYLKVATCHVLAMCSFIRSSFLYDPFLIPHSFRPSDVKEVKFKEVL
jgi:hypothetical protein